jgi:hypothetical protein
MRCATKPATIAVMISAFLFLVLLYSVVWLARRLLNLASNRITARNH